MVGLINLLVGGIGLLHGKFNIINMKKYDITEELRKVLLNYGFFNKS